jgi:hypothetical protein
MEVTPHEPSTPDADSTASRPWVCEPETPDRETILKKIGHEDTPTEPGYGHGV